MNINGRFGKLFDELENGHVAIRARLNKMDENGAVLEEKLRSEMDEFDSWRFRIMDALAEISTSFNRAQQIAHQHYIRATRYHRIVQEAPFYRRIMQKPNGYPGDAYMMNYIYQNRFEGRTPFGKFLHRHAVLTKACQSVRNRKDYLSEQIGKAKACKILSLAAGPALEIKEALAADPECESIFIALDHDMEALTQFGPKNSNFQFRYALANAFTIISGNYQTARPRKFMLRFCYPRRDFKGFRRIFCPLKYDLVDLQAEEFDLVYSAGLYDYIKTYPLDDSKGTVALTRNLFHLVRPGGKLIIGNFNRNNPRDLRFVMEYIYDWKLIYRDKGEMYEFLRSIPKNDIQDVQLISEPTGINYFLEISKKG